MNTLKIQKRVYAIAVLFAGLSAFGPSCKYAAAQTANDSSSDTQTQLSLSDAIKIALKHQPNISIATAEKTEAVGTKMQAEATYLPQITVSYVGESQRQRQAGAQTTSTDTSTGQVAISQNIYDLGVREDSNAAARQSLRASELNETASIHSTILSVASAYYTLLSDIDQVKVAKAQVERYQETVNLTQAEIKAGTAAKNDIYQAQADLASAQTTLAKDENAVNVDSSSLKNAIGIDTDQTIVPIPVSGSQMLPELPQAVSAQPLQESLAAAYLNRPDLLQEKALYEAAESTLRMTKKQEGLSLSVDYSLTLAATNQGVSSLNNYSSTTSNSSSGDSLVSATLSYPLFDGGTAKGIIRVAQGKRDAAKATYDQTKLTVRKDVEQALLNRNNAYKTAQLALDAVKAAQVSYDSAVASRKAQVGSVLDIITAQASLASAQSDYVADLYSYYTYEATLAKATGTITNRLAE